MKVRMRRIESGSLFCALVLGTALTLSPGCGSSNSGCTPGTANCACLSSGACNAGLTCSSGLCTTSSVGPGCGAINSACASIATDACGTCLAQCCCSTFILCTSSTACTNLLSCESNCCTASCNDGCVSLYPSGETNLNNLLNCTITNCMDSCG